MTIKGTRLIILDNMMSTKMNVMKGRFYSQVINIGINKMKKELRIHYNNSITVTWIYNHRIQLEK